MPLGSTASNTSESAFLFHSANGSGGIVDLALGPVPGAQRPCRHSRGTKECGMSLGHIRPS